MISGAKYVLSSIDDGSMKRTDSHTETVDQNRRRFLTRHNTAPEECVLVQLDYDSDDFCRYNIVDQSSAGKGMVRPGQIADGLATKVTNLGLFLPLADCNGVMLYDFKQKAIMLTHLGRHNLEQNGGMRSIEFMTKQFSTNPQDIHAYFSPYAGGDNYPLFAFNGKSIGDVSKEQLISAGVHAENITDNEIDTINDHRYYSHSEFLKGHRMNDGRFAVLAMLTD